MHPYHTSLLCSATNNHLFEWDLVSLSNNRRITFGGLNSSFYTKCSYTADGTLIVSGSTDGNLLIWDNNNRKDWVEQESRAIQPAKTINCQTEEINGVDCSKHEWNLIANCSDAHVVQVWSYGSQQAESDEPESDVFEDPTDNAVDVLGSVDMSPISNRHVSKKNIENNDSVKHDDTPMIDQSSTNFSTNEISFSLSAFPASSLLLQPQILRYRRSQHNESQVKQANDHIISPILSTWLNSMYEEKKMQSDKTSIQVPSQLKNNMNPATLNYDSEEGNMKTKRFRTISEMWNIAGVDKTVCIKN